MIWKLVKSLNVVSVEIEEKNSSDMKKHIKEKHGESTSISHLEIDSNAIPNKPDKKCQYIILWKILNQFACIIHSPISMFDTNFRFIALTIEMAFFLILLILLAWQLGGKITKQIIEIT